MSVLTAAQVDGAATSVASNQMNACAQVGRPTQAGKPPGQIDDDIGGREAQEGNHRDDVAREGGLPRSDEQEVGEPERSPTRHPDDDRTSSSGPSRRDRQPAGECQRHSGVMLKGEPPTRIRRTPRAHLVDVRLSGRAQPEMAEGQARRRAFPQETRASRCTHRSTTGEAARYQSVSQGNSPATMSHTAGNATRPALYLVDAASPAHMAESHTSRFDTVSSPDCK